MLKGSSINFCLEQFDTFYNNCNWKWFYKIIEGESLTIWRITLVQKPHTNLKRFGNRALCAYAPYLWNMLPNNIKDTDTGELGYDRLNGTRKIGPSYSKSVVYIWRILDMHQTGTKHIVRHMQNPSYTYDEYLICIGLGQSISSVICKNLLYSGPSYPSSPLVCKTSRHSWKYCYFERTIWTINICLLTIFYKALLNIIGGKGAISNINYHHH